MEAQEGGEGTFCLLPKVDTGLSPVSCASLTYGIPYASRLTADPTETSFHFLTLFKSNS